MNRYGWWILSGLLVVALGVLAIVLLSTSSSKPVVPAPITLPSAGSQEQSTSTTGATISMPTILGTNIQTADFINADAATVGDQHNPGYYYLGYHTSSVISDSAATDNPPYLIEYISATHYFNIELAQEPIGRVRRDAEQYLMAHLGLNEEQMCELKYMVSVPEAVNSTYASRNLGFSFCPGATVLP